MMCDLTVEESAVKISAFLPSDNISTGTESLIILPKMHCHNRLD